MFKLQILKESLLLTVQLNASVKPRKSEKSIFLLQAWMVSSNAQFIECLLDFMLHLAESSVLWVSKFASVCLEHDTYKYMFIPARQMGSTST